MKNPRPSSFRWTADAFQAAMPFVLGCCLLMACSDGSRTRPPALEVESAAIADLSVPEGNSPAAPGSSIEDRAAGGAETPPAPGDEGEPGSPEATPVTPADAGTDAAFTVGTDTANATGTGGREAASGGQPDERPPVDIFAVMQSAGFALESTRDLADYLPVPPRATGQVGRFTRGDEMVTLARVTYPAEVFADPHENWIRERMALIPDSQERVVRQAATVVHVVAPSEALADEVMHLFTDAMGLSTRDMGVTTP